MATPVVPGYTDFVRIGSGGFAVVYKATQTVVGRDVAVKVLNQTDLEDDARRRFSRECRVVGSLSWHPHIAAVLDAGADDSGRPYLIFELLEGGSLADRLDESGALHWHEALDYAIQMADAVAAAHDQEVLHRDIKPDNILIDRLGRAKLADFGIAAFRDGNDTKTGVIAATLTHAAPEILNGNRATKQSDVYLLGSTVFELIAGAPPFGQAVGEDLFAAIVKISSEPPPKLAADRSLGVPEDLSAAVDRSLAKQPSGRWESIAAFGRALRDVQRAAGLAPTPTPFIDRAGPAPASAPSPEPQTVIRPGLLTAPPAAAASAPATPIAPSPGAEPHRPVTASPLRTPSVVHDVALPTPQTSPEPQRRRGRLLALVAFPAILLVAGLAVAVFALELDVPGIDTSRFRQGAPALSARGSGPNRELGELAVDGDLTTGWLAPAPSEGHELVVQFAAPARLDAIIIEHGPHITSTGSPIDGSGRMARAEIELSDGSTFDLGFDVNRPATRIPLETRANQDQDISWFSIRIREQGPTGTAVAIREVSIETS